MEGTFQGRYEIIEQLGSGGFGTVYKGRQVTTGQLVAIKVMRPADAATGPCERRLGRFVREMRMCARLHHPNIVRLIDFGTSQDGAIYTAFEYVPGQTLADVLWREGGLDPCEAKHFMLQVLDAIGTAHDAGIVHRDLKPKNIMVSPGARRNALVLDFGIGTFLDDESPTEDVTVTGELLGSPGYSAPEQLLRPEATPRSDLFSWALVFIECLTGVSSAMGEPLHRIVLRLLDPEPIRLPVALADHPLGAILRRALVKDASSRNVTAAELLREVDACDVRGLTRAALSMDSGLPASAEVRGVQRATPPEPTAASDTMPPSAPAEPRRERRQVTIVCSRIHVVDAGQARPPEDVDESIDEAQKQVEAITRRFGGEVVSAGTDVVVSCFGWPVARSDDAVRAVRATRCIAEDSARDDAPDGSANGRRRRIALAFGLHTGLVVTRERSVSSAARVAGLVLQRAVEIARLAAPGQTVVSAEMRQLTASAFAYADVDPPPGAGAAGAGLAVLRGPLVGDSAVVLRRTRLVGRDREESLLLELAGKANGGLGQSVLVHGEPGVGKSRLVHDLGRRLRDRGFALLEGRCGPDTVNRPWHLFIDLLERTLDIARRGQEEDSAAVLAKIEAMARAYRLDAAATIPALATLLEAPIGPPYSKPQVSPAELRQLTTDVLLSVLSEMTEAHPAALLLEDLHWSDPSSRDLLARLVAEVPASRLFVVMTARPEFVPTWSPSSVTSLALPRLANAEIERLVGELSDDRPFPAPVVARLVARAEGIPLFAEELVLSVLGSGRLVPVAGRYELARGVVGLEIPPTLRSSLTSRLDRLGRAKFTAQVAAVIGREFRLDVLAALADMPEADVLHDVDVLLAADLVHGRRRLRDTAYSFKHSLVWDAAYALLPATERRRLHSRLAHLLETKFAALATSRPELVARHHAAAGEMEEAIARALQAGAAGLRRSANAEVIAFMGEALSWIEGVDEAEARATAELRLIDVLTVAHMATSGYGAPEVAELRARSNALVSAVADEELATRALWTSLMYHNIRAERDRAYGLGASLLQRAEQRGDVDALVAVLPIHATSLYLMGDLAGCCRLCDRCVELYDPDKHKNHAVLIYGLDAKAYADMMISLALWLRGRRETAWSRGQRALDWAREVQHGPSESMALMHLGGLAHFEGDRARGRSIVDAMSSVVQKHGLSMQRSFLEILRGWAAGDADVSLRALEELRSSGQEIDRSYWLSLAAECAAGAGDLARAVTLVDECIEHARTTGESFYLPRLHTLRAVWSFRADPNDHARSEAALREAIGMAERSGQCPAKLRAVVALARLFERGGRTCEAADLLSAVCAEFSPDDDWLELAQARALAHAS